MKRAILAASALAAGVLLTMSFVPSGDAATPRTPTADAPVVPSVANMIEHELRWGMTHKEVVDVYNKTGGLFDREYAVQLAHLQPGIEMQQLEADKESRKSNFERSYTQFLDTPTGYDVGPLHDEYTYRNNEAIQKVLKGGKTRYFFYMRDRLWKIYDEITLRDAGPLGASYKDAITKLNSSLGGAGRVRTPNAAQGIERTTTEWQDSSTYLRVIDRSNEHLAGVVFEDKNTRNNLSSFRTAKPTDPFAIDPSIAAVTHGGISDPNAARAADADAGAKPKRR